MDSGFDKTILDESPDNRFSRKRLYALPYTYKMSIHDEKLEFVNKTLIQLYMLILPFQPTI